MRKRIDNLLRQEVNFWHLALICLGYALAYLIFYGLCAWYISHMWDKTPTGKDAVITGVAIKIHFILKRKLKFKK